MQKIYVQINNLNNKSRILLNFNKLSKFMILLDTSIYLMLLIEYSNVKTAKISLSCHIATEIHKNGAKYI